MSIFKDQLSRYFSDFFHVVATDNSEWTVKGFIDIYKNIYTISTDTKVVSKIIELMIFPILVKFAYENEYKLLLSKHQNHYPDISFVNESNQKYALDIKSSYRIDKHKINGMTLGAFTGYFRNRASQKNVTFPYQEYEKHYILGIIYTKTDLFNSKNILTKYGIKLNKNIIDTLEKFLLNSDEENSIKLIKAIEKDINQLNIHKDNLLAEIESVKINEKKKYKIEELTSIHSVVRDFDFFIQEKWKIASDKPGSGNTKNIGSTNKIEELKNGTGLFTNYEDGEQIFNSYWQTYMTKDMAKNIDLDKPYFNNITAYLDYLKTLPNPQ